MQERRRPNGRRPVSSEPFTPQLREKVLRYYRENPMATQAQIAAAFNINPGPVSEAIRGEPRP